MVFLLRASHQQDQRRWEQRPFFDMEVSSSVGECRAWARHATVQKDAEPRERKLVQAHGLITRELGVRIVSAFGVRMTGEYLRN